jgi:hypothetical protein
LTLLSKVVKRELQTSAVAKRRNKSIKFVTLHGSLILSDIHFRVVMLLLCQGKENYSQNDLKVRAR